MMIRNFKIMILVFSLFLVFTLNGCTPLPPAGGNETLGGGIGGSDDDVSDSQEEESTSGTEPPVTGDSSNSGSPPPGQPSGNQQQDMPALKEYVLQIIDDPGSTIKAYLGALSLAHQLGLKEYDEFYQMVLDKIIAKMKKTLSRTDLCQNDLIRLIEVGRMLGVEDAAIDEAASGLGKYMAVKDLVTGAEKIYPTVPQDCSSVEYSYDSDNKENGNSWTKITASLLGDMIEQTLFDRVNPEARSYYWQRGKLEWRYNAEYWDSCMLTKKSSIGRADLTKNDGSVSVNTDGTFSGTIISKTIEVEVIETLQPTDPDVDCSEYSPKIYTEPGIIQTYIEGNWADKYNIKVTVDEATEPSETYGQETTFVSANLHIPFPE